MTCKLSIVTISYMSPGDLRSTYQSLNLLDQDVEWIVVDGGSCNQTLNYLHSLPLPLDFTSEADSGIYDAMGKGLSRSNGEFVIFLNAGDQISSWESLKKALSEAREYDVFFASASYIDDGILIATRYAKNPNLYIYHSVPGNQQATIYRRSSLLTIGVPSAYRICGDYALACLMYKAGFKLGASRHIVSKFFLGGASSVNWCLLIVEAWSIQKSILNSPYLLRTLSLFLRFFNIWSLKTIQFCRKVVNI